MKNWTSQEQILPVSVETFEINPNLPKAPKTLKDLVTQYKSKKKIFELKEKREIERAKKDSKFGSFLKSFLVDILLFSAALVTMIITLVVIYMVCGQSKLKALVANIALQCTQTNRSSRYNRQVLCMQNKLVYRGYVTNNNDMHNYLVANNIKKSSLFKG